METYFYKLAFYAHLLASICMFTAILLLIINYKKVIRLDKIELVKIFAILAIAIGSHSNGHISLEKEYGYDPVRFFR
jgi:hypothetical protein